VVGLREHRGEIIGAAAWPAILDRDSWEQLRAIFGARGDRQPPGRRKALLTGLLVCGRCGETLGKATENNKGGYKCQRTPGKHGCNRLSIIAGPTEEFVVEAALIALDTPALGAATVGEPSPARGEITAIEAQLGELADLWAAGDMTRMEWQRARRGLDARLKEAKSVLAASARGNVLGPYLAAPGLLRGVWDELDVEKQRTVLAAVIDYVVIKPAAVKGRHSPVGPRIEIVWRV
jgi:hypothetical protein